MLNLLAVGLDYLMLKKDNVRGDVRERQLDYARRLDSLAMVVYSPRHLGLKVEQWMDNLWVYPSNSKMKMAFLADAYNMSARICKEKKIDVITAEDPFTTGLVGYLLKRRFRIPLNMQVHNDFCDNKYWMRMRKINRLFNQLGKFTLRRADTIRVGTDYERSKLVEILGIPRDKIFVIPVNSVIEKFNADGSRIREEHIKKGFEKILLFTGRLVAQKGIPDLLRVFKIVIQNRPKTLLLIVGSGPQEGTLKKLAYDSGVGKNVIFIGSIAHHKIPEYLAACDMYVIASLFEGTCIAMIEAMAAGKPVVATQFAGAHDLIHDGETGFSVNQGGYLEFAKRVIWLIDNPEKAEEMGRKAKDFISKRFASNRNIDGMIRLWEHTASVRV